MRKRTLPWLFLALMIALPGNPAPAAARPWAIQPVDRYGDQGNDNSLALDSTGRPHVSYREFDWWQVTDYLKYAYWNGISWQVQYVDTAGDVGFASSLALDSADTPSIAYHDSTLNVRYAKREEGAWKVSTVAKGANPSLALDQQGRPHLSYFWSGTTRSDLMYAYWDGVQWQKQVVEQGGLLGRDNALAMDHKGHPHIVYRDYGILAARVKYATWDGNSWHISVLEENIPDAPSRFFNEQNFAIAIDSQDRPHVTYFGAGYSLRYATWNGSSWQFQTIDGNPGMYELPNSLALDKLDRPHVVYHDQMDVPTSLKYAAWDGLSWQTETVDSGNVPGLRNSLKIDDQNRPHISYYVGINGEGGGALNYARPGSLRTVKATPAGGRYDAPQSVKLSTGEVTDVIYYTTDGSQPSTSSARYSAFYPIAILADRTTTLKFFAVDNRGNEGEVQSEVYLVDTSTPLYSLSLARGGSGSGGVRADGAAPAWEGVTATLRYPSGSVVTLTAEPEFGSFFSGWSGACSGTDPCQLTMDDSKSVTATYRALMAAEGFARVSAGAYHNMVLNSAGGVAAWGYNANGQMADGTTANRPLPIRVAAVAGIKEVAAGGGHTLALKEDGTVLAWGLNGNGQLGNGSTTTQPTAPVTVVGLGGVTAISAGIGHSLALKNDGTVVAWGNNGYGQLGDGTTTDRALPTPVKGLAGVKAIAAGTYHSLALKNDGTMVAWGYNGNGRLGDGSNANRSSASTVSGLAGVTAIAAGASHSLALKSNGTVFGWGANDKHQQGDWGFFQQETPKQIPNLSAIKAIAAGGLHSLALKADGTLMAWGDNANGQLGTGNTSSTILAVPVPNLNGVTSVAAGMYHSMALKTDGMLVAWGLNGYGEVGDGTTTPRTAPVQVRFGLAPFTVTVKGPIANGSVSCTTPVSYNKDSICTIKPDLGYRLATLKVNGADLMGEVTGDFFSITGVQEDKEVTASFAAATVLTLNLAGTGGGSVHGGITCSKGGECLPVTFAAGSVVTLMATPDADSTFAGWSGECTVTGNDCSVTMSGDMNVTATFDLAPQVRVLGGAYYNLLAAAYAVAPADAVVQARATLLEDKGLILNRPIAVKIHGGYDAGFTRSQGRTTLKGKMQVRRGTASVRSLVVGY